MKALSKQQMIRVIEGKGAAQRVPVLYDMWIFPEAFEEREQEIRALLAGAPCDAELVSLNLPELFDAPEQDKSYRWMVEGMRGTPGVGLDAAAPVKDWREMERVYREFPSPEYGGLIPPRVGGEDRYCLARWCFLLFERLWSFRGMENALTDFYFYPEEVHRLFDRLTDFYCRVIERAGTEAGADGIFATDDIGTQTGPFFSLEIFREFFKPYYRRMIQKAHERGMHFWLHSCGNIEPFLPDFVEIGLDVIHPIQKHAMDVEKTAREFGGKIALLAGFDVQQTIPYGTPEEVRLEVRRIIDACARPDGRFLMTMGNGSTKDWRLDSLEALYEETVRYSEQRLK